MKTFFLLSVFFGSLLSINGFAQSNYKNFRGKSETLKIGGTGKYSGYSDYFTVGAGINLEASGRWAGVNYTGLLGVDSEGKLYAYTGVGQVVGFYMFKHNITDAAFFNYLALIGIFLPESIFINAYPNDVSRFSFYISPWGVEHRGFEISNQETKVSIEAGVRLAIKVNNFYIEPFAGAKAIYGTKRRGFSAGITVFFESI